MSALRFLFAALPALLPLPAYAQASGSANTSAIIMFVVFILATFGITGWAAKRTRTASDFYTAGGGISGFQNGQAGEIFNDLFDLRHNLLPSV